MVLFDSIEEVFQNIRSLNEHFSALVTLATAFGALLILVYTVKISFSIVQDFKKKYGQWAVISGSTDGIGLAMARELARRGMSIVVIGRNEEKLANTKASLEGETNAGEIVTVKIDLADSSLENFDKIRSQIDPDKRDIGILINNAGTFTNSFKRYNKFDMEYIRNMVNLNIIATLHLTRMIMPGMISRGRGMVVNVSSVFGSMTGLYGAVYAPTKAFLNSFSKQLQDEYSSHPIDIINLTPGAVHTKLFNGAVNFTHTSTFTPTPEDYAKSALNALSTGIKNYSGTYGHGLVHNMAILAEELGLTPFFTKINMSMNAKEFRLSPVPKRKNQQNTTTVPSGGDPETRETAALKRDSNV